MDGLTTKRQRDSYRYYKSPNRTVPISSGVETTGATTIWNSKIKEITPTCRNSISNKDALINNTARGRTIASTSYTNPGTNGNKIPRRAVSYYSLYKKRVSSQLSKQIDVARQDCQHTNSKEPLEKVDHSTSINVQSTQSKKLISSWKRAEIKPPINQRLPYQNNIKASSDPKIRIQQPKVSHKLGTNNAQTRSLRMKGPVNVPEKTPTVFGNNGLATCLTVTSCTPINRAAPETYKRPISASTWKNTLCTQQTVAASSSRIAVKQCGTTPSEANGQHDLNKRRDRRCNNSVGKVYLKPPALQPPFIKSKDCESQKISEKPPIISSPCLKKPAGASKHTTQANTTKPDQKLNSIKTKPKKLVAVAKPLKASTIKKTQLANIKDVQEKKVKKTRRNCKRRRRRRNNIIMHERYSECISEEYRYNEFTTLKNPELIPLNPNLPMCTFRFSILLDRNRKVEEKCLMLPESKNNEELQNQKREKIQPQGSKVMPKRKVKKT